MKNLNEKGFATFEIILALSIISVLIFVAVPKVVQVMDKIFLNYEVEIFCSEIDYARTLSRAATYKPEIFQNIIATTSNDGIVVYVNESSNSYEVQRNTAAIREPHKLGGRIKLKIPGGSPLKITFDDKVVTYTGNVHTVQFISRLGQSVEVNIDSVGRVRGKRNEN